MLNSVHSGCSCFIERAFSSRFLVLGSITVLSWGQLNAIGSEGSPNNEGPLSRRFRSLPLPPEVSKEPLKDPAIVAQENLTAACIKLKSSLENSYNPLPLVDWLNVSNLPSFFEPTIRSLMKREEYFNAIDSLGKYDLAAQPYGFYSNYKLGKKNFKLTTFGVTIDGGITLDERWIVGGGLGYSHSMLDWDSNKHTVNSLYFGPYVGYIFEQAYIDFSLIGVYNYYNINHLFAHSKEENAHDGWDAAARLEGGWDYEWPRYFGDNFFVQPNADLSFLMVFQNAIEEESESHPDQIKAGTETRTYDFFRSRLGVSFRKEFYHAEKGILIPSLSLGWVLMQPLTDSEIYTTCNKTKDKKSKAYPSSNQAYIGLKVQAINKRAMMLSLGGEAYIANLYPVYLGTLRFEWDW